MNLKEIFHFNNFLHKIKLDHSEKERSADLVKEINIEEKRDNDKFYGSEWNQEYELIYLSYVLER
jgi:hypothetical protein